MRNVVLRAIRKNVILLILVLIFILSLLFVPSFATGRNMKNILKQCSITGIVALGLTIPVIAGCIDISVGSIVSLTGVVALSMGYVNVYFAFIVPIIVAIIIGYLNGIITVKFNISSVIVTLGTLTAVRGLSLLYTGGRIIDGVKNTPYRFLGKSSLLGLPVYVFIFFIIGIALGIILWRTSYGRHIYYCGSNLDTCKLFGVKVDRIRISSLMISAVCAAIASIILSSRLNTASPKTGDGWEFDAIAAIVIGGTSLFGGKGSIFNTFVGIFFIGVLINSMILLNIPYAYQAVAKALLIIIAVIFDVRSRRKST